MIQNNKHTRGLDAQPETPDIMPEIPSTNAPETLQETTEQPTEAMEISGNVREDVTENQTRKNESKATKTTPPLIDEEEGVSKEERQIKTITKLAVHKGLENAIREARKTKNPYVLDRVHDDLIDLLKEELKQKGKLKEIQ